MKMTWLNRLQLSLGTSEWNSPNFKSGGVAKNIWRIIKTKALISYENILQYLSLDINCSSKLRVRFSEQIMFVDKYFCAKWRLLFRSVYSQLVYTTQVNSTFRHADCMASLEVISLVLFTSTSVNNCQLFWFWNSVKLKRVFLYLNRNWIKGGEP